MKTSAEEIEEATTAAQVMLALTGPLGDAEMPREVERALQARLERAFRAEKALAQLLAQAAQAAEALK